MFRTLIQYIHTVELATVLLNYNIGSFVLCSLCVGDLVRVGMSSVRVAANEEQNYQCCNSTAQSQAPQYGCTVLMSETC